MSNEIKTRSLTPTEQKYTYAQSMQLEGQTGTISHGRKPTTAVIPTPMR